MRLRSPINGRKISTPSPHSPSLIGSPIPSETFPPKVRKYLYLRGDPRDNLVRSRTSMRSRDRKGARARGKPAKSLVSAAIRQRTSLWSLARVASDGSICLVPGESCNGVKYDLLKAKHFVDALTVTWNPRISPKRIIAPSASWC
jgi:hypothetical protein